MGLQLPERSRTSRLRRCGLGRWSGWARAAGPGRLLRRDRGRAARDARSRPPSRASTPSTSGRAPGSPRSITGVVVWGLIFYAWWRFRRRSDDEIPIQTRYNLPLEIFYTIAPIIMVIVFFAHTVRLQNIVLDDDATPDHTIEVVGQQWSWTFNYPDAVDDARRHATSTSPAPAPTSRRS